MIEFDVDMGYLLEEGELDRVVLNDENGEHEPMTFWFGGGECEFKPFAGEDWSEPNAVRGVCSKCAALMYGKDNYCPNCGARVRKKVDE